MKRRIFALILSCSLILSSTITTHAFLGRVGDWIDGAIDDVTSVIEDAGDIVDRAIDDVTRVIEDANIIDRVDRAISDARKAIDDVLKANPELREIDLLPVLSVDLETLTNVQTASTGSFKYGDNVKQKQLSPSAAQDLKTVLMRDNGFSEYWANFVVNKASEMGERPGEAIVGLLPYSQYYGGRIATAINEAVAAGLKDIDPYKDGLIPVDKLKNFDLTYTVDSSKINPAGNYLVIITGVKYGPRDNFTVTLKSGGQEYATERRALNGKEIAFVAEVSNISDLEVIYNSNFKLPQDATVLMREISADIASSLQTRINNLSPLGNPISNDAKDIIEKAIYQGMFAQFEYMAKAKGVIDGDAVTVNDLFANGDVGVFVADALKLIPGVDQALTLSGWDDRLADMIRDVVNQVEVRTFGELTNGKIYLKAFNSTEEMTQVVSNLTSEAAADLFEYVDNLEEDAVYIGGMDDPAHQMPADLGAEAVEEQEPVMPTTVEIKFGYTVGNISLNYYGDYSMMREIYEANRNYFIRTGDRLNVGDTLVLPTPARLVPPTEDANTKVYTVKLGDTLGSISQEFYGTPSKYTKIAEANAVRIADPNLIFEGQMIAIPIK